MEFLGSINLSLLLTFCNSVVQHAVGLGPQMTDHVAQGLREGLTPGASHQGQIAQAASHVNLDGSWEDILQRCIQPPA